MTVTAAELTGYQDEAEVRFKNVGSGKYLNVHYGQDSNGTNVYQWTEDDSVEQKFKLRYNLELDCYLIGTMCSSDGDGRVLDIKKSNGQIVDGSNVQIYDAVDPVAQQWQFQYHEDGKFIIFPVANPYMVLTANGGSNGSGSGKTATSAGNVYLSEIPMSSSVNYTNYQLWYIEEVEEEEEEEEEGAYLKQTIPNGLYRIANDNNKFMTLDVEDDYNVCQTGNPGNLATDEWAKSQWRAQQLWRVEYLYSGYYLISPFINTSHKLAAFGDYETLSANVYTTFNNNSTGTWHNRQQWKIVPNADGAYRIVSKGGHNSFAVTVSQGDTDDFTNILMVPFTNAPSQRWTFLSAGSVCSGASVGGHIVAWMDSANGYRCMACGRPFDSPQEQDYDNINMHDEELALIFALQRMATLKLIEGDKDHFAQACYKATDIIRSMRDDNNAYDFHDGNGNYISPVQYTYDANSMDASITFEVTTYGEIYAAGRGLLSAINSVLPFPFNAITDVLWTYADPLGEYSFAEWLFFSLGAIWDGTLDVAGERTKGLTQDIVKAVSKTSTLHSMYEHNVSSASYFKVVVEVFDGNSIDRFVGMYDVDEIDNSIRVYKEEHLVTAREWEDAPENLLDGTYIFDHGGTFYVYDDLF